MMERVAQNPNFLTSIVAASGGRLVPNPGGVLIRDAVNAIIGAVGIYDEIIAVAGITTAGQTRSGRHQEMMTMGKGAGR
jgi:uncharacterized protein GlcG (DUF336 family)